MCLNMKTVKGFSLLELVIALAIFSMALLGLMKIQIVGIRSAYSAMLRAQGQVQLLSLIEQTRISSKVDLGPWLQSNDEYLPQSKGGVTAKGVYLQWQIFDQDESLALQVINE